MADLVTISQLDFAYGQQLVLKQIDLSIAAGDTLGIIGPNGGGKTTLLRLLLGQYQPTRGSILIDGLSPRKAVAHGNLVGYLPQAYPIPHDFPLSVRQVVQLGLAGKTGLLANHSADDLEFTHWLIKRVGLTELADRPIGSISGGQQQRALIARALSPRPKLLLLDEPTTGIDHVGQMRFAEFLTDLKSQLGLTVILVSHDLRTISALSDRIACLNVTLHCHNSRQRLSGESIYQLFACDFAAAGMDK